MDTTTGVRVHAKEDPMTDDNRDRPARAALRAARTFLNEIQARTDTEEFLSAGCYIVVTEDPESGRRHYTGTWTDPVAALAWSEKHDREVNTGLGPNDLPYLVTVEPVGRYQ